MMITSGEEGESTPAAALKKKPSVQIQITPKSGPRGNAETLYKNIYVNVIRDVYTISHGTGW